MCSLRLISCWLLVLLATSPLFAQTPLDSTLQTVETLYGTGSYPQAELEARRLLENELLSDSLRIAAEQWVAFALVAQGRSSLAREHFLSILRLRPSYDLDPLFTSPKILTVFNEARVAYRAAQPPRSDSTTMQKAHQPQGITFRTIVFPGWEQLYQQRTTAGTIFLSAGAATLGAGVTCAFLRSSARADYLAATNPADIESKYQTYNRYSQAEVIAFVAFALVYLASEIDVFLHNPSLAVSFRQTDAAHQTSGILVTLRLH